MFLIGVLDQTRFKLESYGDLEKEDEYQDVVAFWREIAITRICTKK
jgi:hypothetical protein